MIITQLIPISKDKVKVYIDMEFAFVLYKGELRRYRMKEEREIKQEDYQIITEEILPKRAKLRCMNLLKVRNYTQKELERKLEAGEYSKKCIEEAIAYVKAYKYIDDRKYAKNYIDCFIEQKSRKKIEYDLFQKGVEKAYIMEAFEEWEEENFVPMKEKEEEVIQKILKKKKFQIDETTEEEKKKLLSYLYRRGFSYELVSKALSVQNV